MQVVYRELWVLLQRLEVELRNLQCWDAYPPSMAALQSQEPFCVDTMEFYQWLQWIFIPRMKAIIDARAELPVQCNITAMAEVWVLSRALSARELIVVSESIDRMLNR